MNALRVHTLETNFENFQICRLIKPMNEFQRGLTN